jgi:hypothetical protein
MRENIFVSLPTEECFDYLRPGDVYLVENQKFVAVNEDERNDGVYCVDENGDLLNWPDDNEGNSNTICVKLVCDAITSYNIWKYYEHILYKTRNLHK